MMEELWQQKVKQDKAKLKRKRVLESKQSVDHTAFDAFFKSNPGALNLSKSGGTFDFLSQSGTSDSGLRRQSTMKNFGGTFVKLGMKNDGFHKTSRDLCMRLDSVQSEPSDCSATNTVSKTKGSHKKAGFNLRHRNTFHSQTVEAFDVGKIDEENDTLLNNSVFGRHQTGDFLADQRQHMILSESELKTEVAPPDPKKGLKMGQLIPLSSDTKVVKKVNDYLTMVRKPSYKEEH